MYIYIIRLIILSIEVEQRKSTEGKGKRAPKKAPELMQTFRSSIKIFKMANEHD